MGIYVELLIHSSLDELWEKTQVPELHRRWDLRFSDIAYLPHPDPEEPQQFLYETRIGFGLRISGMGETLGRREDTGTSALKFWSDDPKSLIREGSGYWRYIPQENGVRFLTWYDYRTRFGIVGRAFDALFFKPLMGWATAWSFDRLRLWIEQGIDPAISLQLSVIYAIARTGVAFIWLYHGLVPKLLFHQHDELALVMRAGFSLPTAQLLVNGLGIIELLLGLMMLVAWRQRSLFGLTISLMIMATIGIAVVAPDYFSAAFNPLTLNLSMIALSVVGYLSGANIPSAKRCIRKQPGA